MTALSAFYTDVLKDIPCGVDLAALEIRSAAEEFLTRSTCWRTTLAPQNWKAATISAITNGSPTLITAVSHGLGSSNKALFANMPALREFEGYLWDVTVVDPDTFTIAVDSTMFDVFSGVATVSVPVYSMPPAPAAYARVCEVFGADGNATTSPGSVPILGRAETSGPDIAITSPDRLDAEWPGWKRVIGDPKWIVGMDETTLRFVPAPKVAANLAWALLVALTLNEDATEIPDSIFARWQDQITSGAKARLYAMPGRPWSNPTLYSEHQERFNTGIYKAGNRARKGYTKTPTVANGVSYGGLP